MAGADTAAGLTPRLRTDGTRSSGTADDATTRIAALDGVRALAVLSVVVHHSWLPRPASLGERLIGRALDVSVGVNVFLVLSGLLVTRSLLGARGRPNALRDFYLRRQLRIAPLYFGFLLAVLVVVPWLFPAHATQIPAGSRIWLFTYLANVRIALLHGWSAVPGVATLFWSLAVQEQFFLFWPTLVLRCPERVVRRVCLALIVGAPLLRLTLQRLDPTGFAALMLMPARADTLALGAYLALLARDADGLRSLRRWSLSALAVTGATVAAIALPRADAWSVARTVVAVAGLSLLALLAAAIAGYAITLPTGTRAARALAARPLARLARYSYCIYIVHPYALAVVAGHLVDVARFPTVGGSTVPAQLALTLAGVLISFLVGWASWELFERHFVALGERFRARRVVAAPEPLLPPPVVAPPGIPFTVGERERVGRST